eukprot:CAMPEP_0178394040 /NCGR_PEP_ID=MMETSP0689_2-20121128/12497_1 /TAXON_ID=160604 /ORGANISM="Amphidinium massartii, Strain CS-259" /LENGTH=452 /DNA_ID=CAMNT_0020014649 /DNA_START=93 /DNA_END=1447 /DNA_ORIENTATION=+
MSTMPTFQVKYDWYLFGGLARTVQLHILPTVLPFYIEHVNVFPKSLAKVETMVRTSLGARTHKGDWLLRGRFSASSGGTCAGSTKWPVMLHRGDPSTHSVKNVRPWLPELPNLHYFTLALLKNDTSLQVLDCVQVRFGMRVITADHRGFWLNNNTNVKLRGVNRHHFVDSPVLTYADMLRDMSMLKRMNANFVRGSHYPQDARFLDLCDVNGILVWEEVMAWQPRLTDYKRALFMKQQRSMATEMVRTSANHPSIIIYACFNEGSSHMGHATFAYKDMAKTLRKESRNSRLISYASDKADRDIMFGYFDVVSFNEYPCWYPVKFKHSLGCLHKIWDVWRTRMQWVKEHFPEKPLIISEAGGGGIYGRHGGWKEKWAEEFQALLVMMHAYTADRNDRMSGIAVWHFADNPVDPHGKDESKRPGGLNNKGVLSLDRTPKLAYTYLESLWNGSQR